MNKNLIITMGDALVDRQFHVEAFPKPGADEPILMAKTTAGGSAANTASILGRLGADVVFFGSIGDDMDGEILRNHLAEANVDISMVQVKGHTGYTIDLVDRTGERTMLSYRGASENMFVMTNEVKEKLREAAIFLISGYVLIDQKQRGQAMAMARLVKMSGGLIAFDPSPVVEKLDKQTLDEVLSVTDVLLPNAREMDVIRTTENVTDDFLSLPCVAVKLGVKGSILGIKKGFGVLEKKPFEKDVLIPLAVKKKLNTNTTGAGDAFNAGFLWSMLNENDPKTWIQTANDTAGQHISGES